MRSLLSLSILACSMSVSAAQVTFSTELIPLELNNEVIEQSIFSKQREFDLTPGPHVFRVKYSDMFEQDFDDHVVVDSKPFWVTLTVSEGDYRVLIREIDDLDVARAFARQPVLTIVSPDRSRRQLISTMRSPFQTNASAVAVNTAVPSGTEKREIHSASQASSKSTSPEALEMLNYWWSKASAAEKAKFLKQTKGD